MADKDPDSESELFLTQNRFRKDDDDGVGNKSFSLEDFVEEETKFRFGNPVSGDIIKKKIEESVPVKTRYKNNWAVNTFTEWQKERLAKSVDTNLDINIACLTTDLLAMDPAILNQALERFVWEARKENSNLYPKDTLYSLVTSIQNHLRMNGRHDINFFEDPAYFTARESLNAVMIERAESGLGIRKQCLPISIEEENMLWDQGQLGTDTPGQLLNTMIYLNGLHFALRGGNEHRKLRAKNPQITGPHSDPVTGLKYLQYCEDTSKTNCGGLKHRKSAPKRTVAYENSENKNRCIVAVYEKYTSLW